ncbi:MAG: flagella synthesis protein FlgN [Gammaproteobacteria bacterium]
MTSTLRDEFSIMNTLIELMKQEQRLLVSADTDGLTAITPQKSQLINQMAALSSVRHQALEQAGFAPEDASMAAWLARAGDKPAESLWQDLLAATRQAKELNRVNGMLIAKQLNHTQTQIAAMRTPAGGADAAVYGATGQTSTGQTSRRLAVG